MDKIESIWVITIWTGITSLHWLRIPKRIVYKTAVLTFKVLHGTTPEYLGLVVCVADLLGRQALRSASTNRLAVPPFKLSTIGSRAFPVTGPQLWNSLPEDITSAHSLLTFRERVKTHLFRQSFPHLVLRLHVYVFFYSGPCSNVFLITPL